MAAELVRRQVAVIVANTPGVLEVKAATTMIPIVFTTAGDPVQIGLVASLLRWNGRGSNRTQQVRPQVVTLAIRRAEDIASAFEAMEGRADALYVCGDLLQAAYRLRINTLALGLRLPTILSAREDAEAAGLISYGPNYPDLYRHAAQLVDKILHGAKPADLPVEQPTKFDLVINLTTAKALGLEVPPTLLARADEVIE
jgi:ABC-type uncharacterized transport system substrate-binding protein